MNPPYLLMAQGKLYPYQNRALLLCCIMENRREGLEPQGVYKLVTEGFGYAYTATSEAELRAEQVSKVIQNLDCVA